MNSFLFFPSLRQLLLSVGSLLLLGNSVLGQEYNFVTLAGPVLGSRGSEDGIGSSARFSQPYGIAVDSSSNVYVADGTKIRKITPAGVVSTLAGNDFYGSADGNGSGARFSNYIPGMAIDRAGNLYLADANNRTIRKVTPSGTVTTYAGLAGAEGTVDGLVGSARFSSPGYVAVDSFGIVYVTDIRNGAGIIRQITPSGLVSTLTGLPGSPLAVNSQGDFFAVETVNLAIGNNSYQTYERILKITTSGVTNTILTGIDRARFVSGAVDVLGNVYVADIGNYKIWKIIPRGTATPIADLYGEVKTRGIAGPLEDRAGLAVDTSGNVYVADTMVQSIRKITPAGVIATLAGGVGHADGEGANALFRHPNGVVVGSAGDVFVADTSNHRSVLLCN